MADTFPCYLGSMLVEWLLDKCVGWRLHIVWHSDPIFCTLAAKSEICQGNWICGCAVKCCLICLCKSTSHEEKASQNQLLVTGASGLLYRKWSRQRRPPEGWMNRRKVTQKTLNSWALGRRKGRIVSIWGYLCLWLIQPICCASIF